VPDSDAHFAGSIPQAYERHLVPLLFAPYAEDLVVRARRTGGRRILEIAAGTGAVTRALAGALPDARIDATDLNEAMVAIGAELIAGPNVHWYAADAAALPSEPASFELVLCQFGVMFFPDRVRAFRETRRVLAPGGTFLFNVWDGLENNDVARLVCAGADEVFPENRPQFLRRTPYGHGDPALIASQLKEAGFGDVAYEAVERRSRAASPREAVLGFCHGSPLCAEILERDPAALARVVDAAARAIETEFGDGPVDARMRAFIFAAK